MERTQLIGADASSGLLGALRGSIHKVEAEVAGLTLVAEERLAENNVRVNILMGLLAAIFMISQVLVVKLSKAYRVATNVATMDDDAMDT